MLDRSERGDLSHAQVQHISRPDMWRHFMTGRPSA